MKLNNKVYDVLKFVAQVFLPAAGALYFGLSGYWNLPNPDSVVGSIVVVDTFLGAVLAVNSKQYNDSDAKYDGQIDVEEGDESKLYSMVLNVPPDQLDSKKEVLFKVNPPS